MDFPCSRFRGIFSRGWGFQEPNLPEKQQPDGPVPVPTTVADAETCQAQKMAQKMSEVAIGGSLRHLGVPTTFFRSQLIVQLSGGDWYMLNIFPNISGMIIPFD